MLKYQIQSGLRAFLLFSLSYPVPPPPHEAVANLREVLRDVLVLDDGVLLADFRRGFLSELHVLLRRVLFLRKLDHRLRRQARCKFLQDGGRNRPIVSLAPERHIGIDRRGAAGGQVAGEKRGAD